MSPKYILHIADILEIDLMTEPYMVGTLKTFLKAFSQQYRLRWTHVRNDAERVYTT